MSTTLKLVNNDITIPLTFTNSDLEDLLQRIKVSLQIWKNEWFVHRLMGVDYYAVLDKPSNYAIFRNSIQEVLKGFEEITRIKNIDYKKVGDLYDVTIEIDTIYSSGLIITTSVGV